MRRKPLAAINITPLVDVLLILLVVLMLAMPMFVKRLPVDLPQTSLAGSPAPVKALEVSVREDGGWWVKGSPVSKAHALSQITPETSVELSADKSVRYEALAQAIAAIQEKAPKEIALVTR